MAQNLLFDEMGEKLLLKDNITKPKKALEAGYIFQYTYVDQALSNMINKT
ncbi:DUF1731 domain-containing protein [Candidatus Aquarickettsia rohweri]|uniref:DUF1731 domain-containing protein n=1 Tax=Candidatus Aquarickettsia rohweri TaxID=2602574 RepID=A0A3R9XNC6_9RICK|nr:DUF1731 domain-containing protein [Candidatus Aquarickettsia rohweri]RST64610.1 DUF1731 domain-containing protein [Candidatus Aquarickettsia rohweri]